MILFLQERYAIIVKEPASSVLRAAPKNRFGCCKAFASIPPVRILPDDGATVLYARARRVIESSNNHHMMTNFN